MDGYEVQGQVWIAPDPGKVNAWYLNPCPTTQLLYQGAGTTGKRPEELLTIARCGAQGGVFDSCDGGLLFTSSIPQ